MPFSTERRLRSADRAAGYSLAEVVISLAIFTAILVGVLLVFNLNYRQARSRSDAARRHEALRGAQDELVRLVATAGRDGLPAELAIGVRSNVAPGSRVAGPASPRLVTGTDVLTVRGVFSTPLLRGGPHERSGGEAESRAVELHDPSPETGVAQELAELAAAIEARGAERESLLLVSQLDESILTVVTTDLRAAQIARVNGRVAGIGLTISAAGAPSTLAGGGLAAALRGPVFVGILEEYRFFVREAFAAPGDPDSKLRPQLSVARFVPGTDQPWGGAAGRFVDLADEVFDLQVALGIDADGDGSVTADPDDPRNDEWLYDDPRDDPGAARWSRPAARLSRVRISAVTRFEGSAAGGLTAVTDRLEDRRLEPLAGADAARLGRLESVVDLGWAAPAVAPGSGSAQSR